MNFTYPATKGLPCIQSVLFVSQMDPSSVPLLAWHFVAVQNSVNPMLAFCRGDVVHFLLVSLNVLYCVSGNHFLFSLLTLWLMEF